MTKERFTAILREYDVDPQQIEELWERRPTDDLDEPLLRKTTERFKNVLKEVREIYKEAIDESARSK